ncbi:MAG: metallophosphoesterase family protein [Planctomycetota bacterium]
MKLLLSGDIHIGRASTRVDEPRAHRAAEAWGAMCELAIRQGVRAVCLSGDITDQDNRFWEAIGPLEEGIAQLAEHDIPTLAVSGNHDHDVLVRLADNLPPEHFVLLGRDGQWQRHTLTDDAGRSELHVDGWSFPQKRVTRDPLTSYDLPRPDDAPVMGMVHGDLDAASSPYGPLSSDRLASVGPDAWLLGHIHTPALRSDRSCWLLYPGSPQALDPDETGSHGPWLAELVDGHLAPPEQIPYSSVRYEGLEIDLSDCEDIDSAGSTILERIRDEADTLIETGGDRLTHLLLRPRLVGRTPVASTLQRDPNALRTTLSDFSLTQGQATVSVEPPKLAVLPVIDVGQYARQASAAGAAARVLEELDAGGELSEATGKLLDRTTRALRHEATSREYTGIDRLEIDGDRARQTLRSRTMALLTELVRQQEAGR